MATCEQKPPLPEATTGIIHYWHHHTERSSVEHNALFMRQATSPHSYPADHTNLRRRPSLAALAWVQL